MRRVAIIITLAVIFISCKKESNYLQPLISHPWEETGIFDTVAGAGYKQFYCLQFFENNDVEIVIDFGGVFGIPDPLNLDTMHSLYRLDEKIIVFPDPIDTMYSVSPPQTLLIYINSWEIISLNEEHLVVRPVENYQPPDSDFGKFIIGGLGEINFKPLD